MQRLLPFKRLRLCALTRIKKSRCNKGCEEGGIINSFTRLCTSASTRKSLVRKAKWMVTSFKDRKTTSVVSTPSSASSNPGVLLGGVSGSRTPTLSLNNIHYPISEAPSSHPPLPPVAGREQATTVNETMTSRAEEVIGGEVILWEPSLRQASCHLRWREGHEPD